MQPTDTQNVATIEPIERFLTATICVDKLALYQPIIDLLKEREVFSVLDSLTALVDKMSDQTSADILDELNDVLIKYLKQLIAEFDIICSSQDIVFLKELYEVISLLDSFDQHEVIMNICSNDQETLPKLYSLISIIVDMDEMEFYDRVQVVPLMFFDRLHEIHSVGLTAKNALIADDFPEENIELIRKIAERNPQLTVINLIREQYLVKGMNAQQLTNMITEHFHTLNLKDHKRVALELISLYLLTGQRNVELVKTIQTQLEQLVEDINEAHGVYSVLQATLSEVNSYD